MDATEVSQEVDRLRTLTLEQIAEEIITLRTRLCLNAAKVQLLEDESDDLANDLLELG